MALHWLCQTQNESETSSETANLLVILTNLFLQRCKHAYMKQCFSKGNGLAVIQKLFFFKDKCFLHSGKS